MKVTAAGQVLLDDVQTSPGVYKHGHAGLDHFWECFPELNGGWNEDSSSDAQLQVEHPRMGNSPWLLQLSEQKAPPSASSSDTMHRTARTVHLVLH